MFQVSAHAGQIASYTICLSVQDTMVIKYYGVVARELFNITTRALRTQSHGYCASTDLYHR